MMVSRGLHFRQQRSMLLLQPLTDFEPREEQEWQPGTSLPPKSSKHFDRALFASRSIQSRSRAVPVDGMNTNRPNMLRKRVHGIVQRFRAAAQEVLTGRRRVEVWLPPELAQQVEAMSEEARAPHTDFDQSER